MAGLQQLFSDGIGYRIGARPAYGAALGNLTNIYFPTSNIDVRSVALAGSVITGTPAVAEYYKIQAGDGAVESTYDILILNKMGDTVACAIKLNVLSSSGPSGGNSIVLTPVNPITPIFLPRYSTFIGLVEVYNTSEQSSLPTCTATISPSGVITITPSNGILPANATFLIGGEGAAGDCVQLGFYSLL